MNDFQLDFSETSTEAWKNQILKELKDDASKIEFTDKIEEISLDITLPATDDFNSARSNPTNDWKASAFIEVNDEKTANKLALNCLNQGYNELIFKFNSNNIDWELLIKDVLVEYIHTRLVFNKLEQLKSFLATSFASKIQYFSFEIDPLASSFETLENEIKTLTSNRVVSINGFEIQQTGATTWQEIGIILSTAHELLNRGFNPNQLSLSIGIGSNYFLETAKIRALRYLWNQITTAYDTDNSVEIVAHVGWTNKSLKDQHTNLLRQTTETMSAAAGGADSIVVHPYDQYAIEGSSEFAYRMAANISNLLKEESYFDKVEDPLKGSRIIENLTQLISKKAWNYFLELDTFKSLNSIEKIAKIKGDISSKRAEREQLFKEKQIKLIGINLFITENPNSQEWKKGLNYLEIPYLIYEEIIINENSI
jgi:methylmalonyl-CoA mutase